MKPLALRYGTVETVTIQAATSPAGTSQGDEIALRRDVHGDLVVVADGGEPRPSRPADPTQAHRLDGLLEASMPSVCVVLDVLPRGEREQLVVEVRSFAHHVHLDQPLTLTIGPRVRDELDDARFHDEFVLDPAAGGRPRAVVSSGPDQGDVLTTAFQLHGVRRNAIVTGGEDGLIVARLVTSRHGIDELVTPVALVDAPAIELRAEPADVALQTLLAVSGAVPSRARYLELQERFLPLDKAHALSEWDRFGALPYDGVTTTGDIWHFALEQEPSPLQRQMLEATRRSLTAVKVGATPVPGEAPAGSDGAPADRLWPDDGDFAGSSLALDGDAGRALRDHLELGVLAPRPKEPPPASGELRLALRGTQVAWSRRKWAFERMLGGDGPPRLARLLGEMTGPIARPCAGPALDERELARAFDGHAPTPGQAAAIRVAVQTPDVAIIHGPPGTGKTRVIHAVSAQLADRFAPRSLGEPPALLLTSHGQEAVRNVAEQTEVFDMPAATLGLDADRGRSIGEARRWADARLAEQDRRLAGDADLRELLEGADGTSVTEAQRVLFGLHREVATYELAPTGPAETAELLDGVLAHFGHHLSHDTVLALREKSAELTRPESGLAARTDELYAPAVRAVRGIRTVPAAWDDDGPQRAAAAIAALRPHGLLDAGDERTLAEATAEELDAVDDLRARLLDTLIERMEPPLRPGVDESVRALLTRATGEARDKVMGRRDGVTVILAEYRDALKHDLPQVERLKREYASLVATTCQKAQDGRLLSPLGQRPRFETVIVDEAARASPLDLLIPLCGATRRVILVGDHRQLPDVLDRELEQRLEQHCAADYGDLLRRSLFEHVRHAAEKQTRLDDVPRVALLDEQFRMHPRLGSVMNEVFYAPHGERVGNGKRKPPTHGVPEFAGRVAAWIPVPHEEGPEEHHGTSWQRPDEADVVADRVVALHRAHPDASIGVIAFYLAQVIAIRRALAVPERGLAVEGDAGPVLRDSLGDKLMVGTVDGFQGREFKIVLLSVTRSNTIVARAEDERSWWRKWGHLRMPNRMCVALSRQKALLLAVGDRAMASNRFAEKAVPGLWRLEQLCREEEEERG